jgi:hemolysin activation/secretion protein
LLSTALGSGAAFAQVAAPVTVTPQTLRPEQTDKGFRVDIPESGGLVAPAGAEGLSVTLSDVALDGGFPEVAGQTDSVLATLRGARVSLKQIYAVASEIEAIHARAGYVLARVSVPPQDLHDGGALRIIVTDGFIEAVDVAGIPKRVRSAVAVRAKPLIGRRHLRLSDIEQRLLIANDVPGLSLRSTLARGEQPGATRIILEGKHNLVSGSLGADNQLDPSLGRWSTTAQVSLNSALGFGEQIYGFVSSGYDVSVLFNSDVRERVLGGGFVLPIGSGRLTLNPEVVFSRTQPTPGAGAPATRADFQRLALRAGYTILKTRAEQLSLNGAIEQIDERNEALSFATLINHDRYMLARLGISYDRFNPDRSSVGGNIQISQGLAGLGSISVADAVAANVPFSRQGSSTIFTKITAQGHGYVPLNAVFNLNIIARGQTSFGSAVFRAEQFSLEGAEGASAYVGGVTATDEGAVIRTEVSAQGSRSAGNVALIVAPYVFGAAGIGRVNQPTQVEAGSIKLASVGLGLRATLPRWRLSLGIEYAYGTSDAVALRNVDRLNVTTTLRF